MNDRYEVMFGPNTRQWWVYDSEKDLYIDPPIEVRNQINNIPPINNFKTFLRDFDAEEKLVTEIVNSNPYWLHDKAYFETEVEI